MEIERTQVYGFDAAIRAMRNPFDSWDKSKSKIVNGQYYFLCDADIELSQKLTRNGTEHAKHLRMIQVWADMTLSRYVWSEFDTYKHNSKISCSTMHTLKRKPLQQSDFEHGCHEETLAFLNNMIESGESIDKIKNALPEGFLQLRTVNTNYAELLNIYNQRHNHRLKEWHVICDWIVNLPYFKELTGIEL